MYDRISMAITDIANYDRVLGNYTYLQMYISDMGIVDRITGLTVLEFRDDTFVLIKGITDKTRYHGTIMVDGRPATFIVFNHDIIHGEDDEKIVELVGNEVFYITCKCSKRFLDQGYDTALTNMVIMYAPLVIFCDVCSKIFSRNKESLNKIQKEFMYKKLCDMYSGTKISIDIIDLILAMIKDSSVQSLLDYGRIFYKHKLYDQTTFWFGSENKKEDEDSETIQAD